MSTTRALPRWLAAALILVSASAARADWRYQCPKCGRDLGQAVGPAPTRCGACGWQKGMGTGQPGSGVDPCLLASCLGGTILMGLFVFLAVVILPKLVAGKPRKPRRRRRRDDDDDDFVPRSDRR